jgi:hypothetical protein
MEVTPANGLEIVIVPARRYPGTRAVSAAARATTSVLELDEPPQAPVASASTIPTVAAVSLHLTGCTS